jgi:hypothetical protein
MLMRADTDGAEPCLQCGGKTRLRHETEYFPQRKMVICGNCQFGWESWNGNIAYEIWGDEKNPSEAGTTWFEKVPEGCLAVFQWDSV